MRILCDQMVRKSYVTALSAEAYHTVRRVRSFLGSDADDATISAYAAEDDWV